MALLTNPLTNILLFGHYSAVISNFNQLSSYFLVSISVANSGLSCNNNLTASLGQPVYCY